MTWAERLSFSVNMKPVGKERPRAGKGITYTPGKTAKAEAQIAGNAREAMQASGTGLVTGPVILVCTFELPQAKSWPQWKKRQRAGAFHTSTPDLDNLYKLVEDALNGVAYYDDGQVVATKAVKLWSADTEGAVHVKLMEQEDDHG